MAASGAVISKNVIAQLGRRQDGDPAAAGADDAGALKVGEEAADALARGTGELGQVGLVHADRDLASLCCSRCLFGDELGEDAGDATGDGLEGLAGDALVGGAQPPHQAAISFTVISG